LWDDISGKTGFMDWNGWHSSAQARGDGLRPELLQGLERLAAQAASVIELDAYRRAMPEHERALEPRGVESCAIIPFPTLAKRRVVPERWPRKEGLKPRQSRARNLSRPAPGSVSQQSE